MAGPRGRARAGELAVVRGRGRVGRPPSRVRRAAQRASASDSRGADPHQREVFTALALQRRCRSTCSRSVWARPAAPCTRLCTTRAGSSAAELTATGHMEERMTDRNDRLERLLGPTGPDIGCERVLRAAGRVRRARARRAATPRPRSPACAHTSTGAPPAARSTRACARSCPELVDQPALGGPAAQLVAVRELQLLEDGRDVVLHRLRRDPELERDLLVEVAARDQVEHLALARRQARELGVQGVPSDERRPARARRPRRPRPRGGRRPASSSGSIVFVT